MNVVLNNGVSMPLLGLGCWDLNGKEARTAVEMAIDIGYRLFDTAAMYGNEREVGEAIRNSSIRRENVFITTKVNNADQGYDHTLKAYDRSCKDLKVDHLDLYLIHWPIKRTRKETWKALEYLYVQGRVRAIGVANYHPDFLLELDSYSEITPSVNQCEFSPYLYDQKLLASCTSRSIVLQAWAPLVRGRRFDDPKLISMATKYHKTPAQIIIRWALQQNISTIPKSSSKERLIENFDVFDFHISGVDMNIINHFDEGYRMSGLDPMSYW